MELSAVPPAELAPIADPSARGAAPSLRPPGTGDRAPPAAVPFELLLGLLTAPPPGGEGWPASGKKLPVARPEAAAESMATSVALAASGLAVPPLADPPLPGLPAPLQSAAQDLPAFPVAEGPSAMARPASWLLALSGYPAQAPQGDGGQRVASRLPSPDGIVPADAEPMPVDTAALRSAAAFPAAGPELEGLESAFSNDARWGAQLASAATAEPRAVAPVGALPAAAANVPPALSEAYAPFAREKLPLQLGDARRLDAFGALTPPPAGEAAAGVATEWLPATHTQAHGTTGMAAAPALPNAPVDARLPNWHEALAQRVQWLVDTEAGEARIKLNPPELGAVDVKISLVDDKTHVHLTASTAAARDELAQSLPRLRELLTSSGLELGSASVHDGRGEHASRGDHARHGDAPREHAAAPLAGVLDEPAAARRGPARGRIDVFA